MLFPKRFDIKKYSQAPLRFAWEIDFANNPETVFNIISDQHALLNWVPLMKSVSMEHNPNNIDECGIGSIRHCSLHGMGGIDETILWWDPPYGYAFKVEAKSKIMMPTKDHVSVMLINQLPCGGSRLTWEHYFHWSGFFMRHITAILFPRMMKKALNNIRKTLNNEIDKTFAITNYRKTCEK